MAFLERPWIKSVVKSRYMMDLLRFLRIGRKYEAIRSRLSSVPEPYLLGALEALEKLGIVGTINVQGEKIYVLTDTGKVVLSQLESLEASGI